MAVGEGRNPITKVPPKMSLTMTNLSAGYPLSFEFLFTVPLFIPRNRLRFTLGYLLIPTNLYSTPFYLASWLEQGNFCKLQVASLWGVKKKIGPLVSLKYHLPRDVSFLIACSKELKQQKAFYIGENNYTKATVP